MDNTQQVTIMGAPNPELGPQFQYQVVTLMARDVTFFRTNYGWLTPDHFSLVECQLVLTALYDFYMKYSKPPTIQTMELHLTDEVMPSGAVTYTPEDMPQLCALLAHIRATTVLEPEYYQARLQSFVQEVEVFNLMREASTQGFGNQADTVLQGVEKIKSSGANSGGLVLTSASKDDPELFMSHDETMRIPTGIRKLDNYLSGGIALKELGMVTACTGVGKTNALINFQHNAVAAGYRALLISTELPIRRIKHRYQAMAMGIPADYFKVPVCDWPDEILYNYQFFIHPDYRFHGRDVFIDCSIGEPSIMQIEQGICQWKASVLEEYGEEEAKKCVLVCVDWLDYISDAGMGGGNSRSDELLTNKARALGFTARRTNTGIWTATQGTREADGEEVLKLRHTSGAYHKNDALDISIGLGRVNTDGTYGDDPAAAAVDEDSDEAPPSERELVTSIMKNRGGDGAGSVSFPFYQGPSLRFWENKDQMENIRLTRAQRHLYTDRIVETLNYTSRRR